MEYNNRETNADNGKLITSENNTNSVSVKLCDEPTIENDEDVNERNSSTHQNDKSHQKKNSSFTIISICLALLFIGVILGTAKLADVKKQNAIRERMCEYGECTNDKIDGGYYCINHSCVHNGCYKEVSYNSHYCALHRCMILSCNRACIAGGFYCTYHSCSKEGCKEEAKEGISFCWLHSYEFVDNIYPTIHFSLNSENGIKFYFSAKNETGRTIDSLRFKLYLYDSSNNSVYSNSSRQDYIYVEIAGPAKPNEMIKMDYKIIGYRRNLREIEIKEMTVVYSDGKSETGYYPFRRSR